MHTATESPWRHLVLWVRLYYAIHFLESGFNYVLFHFIPDFSRAGISGTFQQQLIAIGLYHYVKYAEAVLGVLLLFNLAAPLALILMAAISFIIIYLNLFISPDPRQLFSGTQELLLIGTLLLAYGGYYADYCRMRAQPWWFWDGFSGRGRPVPPRPAGQAVPFAAARPRDYLIVIVVAAVTTAIVAPWSCNFGARPLRLYDYGPPLAAAVLALAVMAWQGRQGQAGTAH